MAATTIKQEVDSEDDEDAVVEERRVSEHMTFYNFQFTALSTKIDVQLLSVPNAYQLQFPQECGTASELQCASDLRTRFKRRMQKLELVADLEQRSASFNQDRSHDLSRINQGSDGPVNRITYTGSMVPCREICGAVGCFVNDTLCVTPLSGNIALRPSYGHMLKSADTSKKTDLNRSNDSATESEPETATSSTQAIRVRFARDETAHPKTARRRHETQQQKYKRLDEADPWLNVAHNSAETSSSASCRQEYFSSLTPGLNLDIPEAASSHGTSITTELIRCICPEPVEHQVPSSVSSKDSCLCSTLRAIRALPVTEQITQLFKRVHVFTWSELKSLLPSSADDSTIISMLDQIAVLVLGCWVVKSERVYLPESTSLFTGINSTALRNTRDYVLYCFARASALNRSKRSDDNAAQQTELLTRKEILQAVRIPDADLTTILQNIGRHEMKRGWRFVKDEDADYIKNNAPLVSQYAQYWDERWTQLQQWVRANAQATELAAAAAGNVGLAKRRRRTSSTRTSRRTRSRTESQPADVGHSPSPQRQRRASMAVKGEPLSPTKTLSHSPLKRGQSIPNGEMASPERDIKTSTAPRFIKVKQSRSPVKAAADVNAHEQQPCDGDTQAESSLRQFLRQQFDARPVLSVKELCRLLRVKCTEVSADHPLAKLSPNEFQQRLVQLLADLPVKVVANANKTNQSTAHIITSTTLFAYASGNNWPEVRNAIVTVLSTKSSRFRLATIRQQCLIDRIEVPNDEQLKTLLMEYCSHQSGLYSVREC